MRRGFLLIVAASVGRVEATCVYHLHIPKCAGTFIWRFFKDRFCDDPDTICSRDELRLPPACACAVNPITSNKHILTAIREGRYSLVSSHSFYQLGNSRACSIVVWFREPVSRVTSHFSYFRDRRGLNATDLAAAIAAGPPKWASNQQWALLFAERPARSSPSLDNQKAATEKLRSLAFLGLVDEMDASLCLFSTRFLPSAASDLCNPDPKVKPQKHNTATRKHRADRALESIIKQCNRFDLVLYDLATQEFYARLRTDTQALRLSLAPRGWDISSSTEHLALNPRQGAVGYEG